MSHVHSACIFRALNTGDLGNRVVNKENENLKKLISGYISEGTETFSIFMVITVGTLNIIMATKQVTLFVKSILCSTVVSYFLLYESVILHFSRYAVK